MAVPQIQEAKVSSKNTVLLYFDTALDKKVPVPVTSFTVNYGQYSVSTVDYVSDTIIGLTLEETITFADSIFVSYEPPLELPLCIRGPVPPTANEVVKKRNAVRAFYRYPAHNQIAPDEEKDGSQSQSNLGTTIGGFGFPYQNRSGKLSPGQSNPSSATPDDFVVAYGLKEAVQLTNIDDSSAVSVNVPKLWMAIQDANSLIDSYIEQSGKAGQVLISSNRRRTALIIARYYLDTVRRRDDVKADFDSCLKQMQAEMQMSAIRAGNGDSAIDTPQGIMRSFRVPQRYNASSGKGFSGWVTDTAGDQGMDYRQGYGSIGQNNVDPNWISMRNFQVLDGDLTMVTPNDAGGITINGIPDYGP